MITTERIRNEKALHILHDIKFLPSFFFCLFFKKGYKDWWSSGLKNKIKYKINSKKMWSQNKKSKSKWKNVTQWLGVQVWILKAFDNQNQD